MKINGREIDKHDVYFVVIYIIVTIYYLSIMKELTQV